MVYHHEVLEHGDFSRRQQVVRWVRRFPFAFLSDRQYSIARAEFVEAGEGEDAFIYGLSKVGVGAERGVACWWGGYLLAHPAGGGCIAGCRSLG
jgi:hypothetical protein